MGKKITQENDSASLLCSGGFGGTSPTTMRQIQFPTYIETYIAGFERERERERERRIMLAQSSLLAVQHP
jgi:hypothetical protein